MTLSDLATLLLRDIGVVDAVETPTAADSIFVQGKLTRANERLAQLGLALWAVDDVPDYAADAVVAYTIPAVAPSYSRPTNGYVDEQIALRRIRELVADRRSNDPGTAEYF